MSLVIDLQSVNVAAQALQSGYCHFYVIGIQLHADILAQLLLANQAHRSRSKKGVQNKIARSCACQHTRTYQLRWKSREVRTGKRLRVYVPHSTPTAF